MIDKKVYAFSAYHVDPSGPSGPRLMQGAEELPLRPKTMATLLYLIEHRDETVSKDALLQAIWPDVVVVDQAVFQSISEIRAVLGANCIETRRGSGYLWKPPTMVESERPDPRWRRIAIAAMLLAGTVSLWAFWPRSTPATTVFIVRDGPATIDQAVPSGLEPMLVSHLRNRGWNAAVAPDDKIPAGAFRLEVTSEAALGRVELTFQLTGSELDISGVVPSETLVGAARDLASDVDPLLAIHQANGRSLSVATLFQRAQEYAQADKYVFAEVLLTEILREQPEHLASQIALANVYANTQRREQAIAVAEISHGKAMSQEVRQDQMAAALLLSEVLLLENELERATVLASEAYDLASSLGDLLTIAESQEQLGDLSLASGNFGKAREHYHSAMRFFESFCPDGKERLRRRMTTIEGLNSA